MGHHSCESSVTLRNYRFGIIATLSVVINSSQNPCFLYLDICYCTILKCYIFSINRLILLFYNVTVLLGLMLKELKPS